MFKVGDKVMAQKGVIVGDEFVGEVGEVIEVLCNYRYVVLYDGGLTQYVHETDDEMTLVGNTTELDVKKGDVLECVESWSRFFTLGKQYTSEGDGYINDNVGRCSATKSTFKVISRAAKKEEPKMSNFIETTTVKTIKTVIDGKTSNYADISVKPSGKYINLVIGAKYDNNFCCEFSKTGLKDLISDLQEIHDVMVG